MERENEYWQAVVSRDKRYDDRFVFAVRSTGIYCRPSCPSRRPNRAHVRFYGLPAQAEREGFRACKRCQPNQAVRHDPRLELIQQICQYVAAPHDHTVTLAELSEQFHMSPYHLQRTFKRLVGVTPRQYGAANRVESLKRLLKKGEPVTDAIYEAGYQSSSGVYDRAARRLGMSPRTYRNGGTMTSISFSITPSPLGSLLVAATEKGICAVRLGDSEKDLEAGLYREFPMATVRQDEGRLGPWVNSILSYLEGEQPHLNLPVDIRATAFQRRVYQALQAIPYGNTRSYQDIARTIGHPRAARAVGHACATNPVALIVPCHRAVREDGGLGGYRWGIDRKRALIERESQNSKVQVNPGG